MDISVIVFVRNCKPKVQSAYDLLSRVLHNFNLTHEILFFDDASRDGTPAELQEICRRHANVKIFSAQKRSGFGAGLRFLLGKALGNVVLYADIDLPIALSILPSCFDKMRSADILVVSRFSAGQGVRTPRTTFLFKIYRFACRSFFKIPVRDVQPKLVLFYRDAVAALELRSSNQNIFPEVFFKGLKKRLTIEEIPAGTHLSPDATSDIQRGSLFLLMDLWRVKG